MLRRLHLAAVAGLGLLMAGGAAILVRLGPLPGRGADMALLFPALVALYLAALYLVWRGAAWEADGGGPEDGGPPPARRPAPALFLILMLGLLMRLPLVAAPPRLSDDVYRYVWDGRVARQGINPFRYAPTDTALAGLRDADWERINHPDLVTIYPPAAQLLFAAAAWVAPGVAGLKVLLLVLDLAVALVLAFTIARKPGRSWALLLYWWHPLPLLEFSWSGHADVLGILLLVAAVALAERAGSAPSSRRAGGAREAARSALVGLFLAGSTLVKFLALPAAPFVVGRRWRVAVLAGAIAAAGLYLPYLGSDVNPLGSLGTYAARWRANDFFFGLLLRPGTPLDQEARLAEAKLYAAALVAGVAALAAVLRAPRPAAVATVLGSLVLLSPTIHPWYLAWIVPLLAFRFSATWLYVSLAALLAYQPLPAALAGQGWKESPALKAAAAVPFLILAAWDLIRFLRGRGSRQTPVASAITSSDS